MFKILLKHYIYEKCIDVIFRGISKNFKSPVNLRYNITHIEESDLGGDWIEADIFFEYKGGTYHAETTYPESAEKDMIMIAIIRAVEEEIGDIGDIMYDPYYGW